MRKPHQSQLPLSLFRLERRFAVWREKLCPGQPHADAAWVRVQKRQEKRGIEMTSWATHRRFLNRRKSPDWRAPRHSHWAARYGACGR
jgi:hypothetical protein